VRGGTCLLRCTLVHALPRATLAMHDRPFCCLRGRLCSAFNWHGW
jgi:hypothetical protein